ncbi:MAG: hypothetical protein ACI9OJ_004032 [Myxococcota bacterium]
MASIGSLEGTVSGEGGYPSYEGFWKRARSATTLGKKFGHILKLTGWTQNGTTVSDCVEYVYEKYWDWSLFLKEVETNKADYRGWFNAAYATQTQFVQVGTGDPWGTFKKVVSPLPGAVGALAVDGSKLKSKDGNALVRQPTVFPIERAKNLFFTMNAPSVDAQNPAMPLPNDFWTETALANLSSAAETGCGGHPLEFVPCDPVLQAKLFAGQSKTVVETWEWHQNISAALMAAGWTDEHLSNILARFGCGKAGGLRAHRRCNGSQLIGR